MPHVYRSSVKETNHKALLKSAHPPYQGQPAAEEATHTVVEAAHTAADEATYTDTPRDTEPLLIILRLIRLLLILLIMMLLLMLLILCRVHRLRWTRL